MSPSATRGAVLVAIAALLAFLILRGAADNTQFPVVNASAAQPTATPAEPVVEPNDTVDVVDETAVVDTGTARNNNEVSVLVVNGTNVSQQASRLTSALRNQGFLTLDPRNADDPQAASVIFYRPGYAAEAAVVRSVLGGSTPIAPMPDSDPLLGANIDLSLVNVLVLIGDDDLADS